MEAIGQLTGGNCHDFNNIMTVIIRYAGMLMNNLDEHDPQYLPISEISRAGERAATLTKQLLAFGRRQLLRPVGLDLNDHLRDLQQMLQTLLGDNISLELSLNATPCTIKIDPIQVQQIIINLAVNARDAMSEAGTLSKETIRLNKNVPEIVKKDGVIALCVMIAIHDSGHGIEKKDITKIYEPFFTTKEVGDGSGLRLKPVCLYLPYFPCQIKTPDLYTEHLSVRFDMVKGKNIEVVFLK